MMFDEILLDDLDDELTIEELVGSEGLEPSTSTLSRWHSAIELTPL